MELVIIQISEINQIQKSKYGVFLPHVGFRSIKKYETKRHEHTKGTIYYLGAGNAESTGV
jgi:hypothetical protein